MNPNLYPKKQITIDEIIHEYGSLLNNLGLENKVIKSDCLNWRDNDKGSNNDYLWYLFNKLLSDNKKLNPLQILEKNKNIYYKMGLFVMKYEQGNRNTYTRMSFDAELNSYVLKDKDSLIEFVTAVVNKNCCEYCDSFNGLELSPSDMLNTQPLASDKCTNLYGCNCVYSLKPKRDKDNHLIYKSKV
ncbi:hypothetical protein A5M85_05920 [Cellulophaga lytica]|uniref:hypothetical protein n=1 Tax=Cellulophaga lytica TaxID=979 RepID=UPI000950AAA6|nr:hypothetical protein [Cellulophaga lytica]APU09832.1 hypothetical protein A5M85_05920 [Cellulophaga lytica]